MQKPEQAPLIDQLPIDEPSARRFPFSLAALMIAMSLVCVLLVLLPVCRFLLDQRTIAFLAVIVVAVSAGGKLVRGAAVGGIVGICVGLHAWDQRWWGWNEPATDIFTVLTIGACAAWFVAAIQLTKRGEKAGLVSLLTLLIWLPYWLLGAMR